MAIDFSQILQSAPQLFRDLPFLMNLAQTIFYAGLVLTFGGFVMKGYGGAISAKGRVLGKVVFGILALVTGLGISWVIPVFSDVPMYAILQTAFINVVLGGLMATAVLYLSITLISYHVYNIDRMKHNIKRIRERLKKARKVESDEKKHGRRGLKNPVRIAGLAIFIGFLLFGLSGFTGFPNPMDSLGFDEQDLDRMAGQIEDLNEQYGDVLPELMSDPGAMEECMGAVGVMEDQAAIQSATTYTDPGTEAMIEAFANEEVVSMLGIDSDSGFYVFAMTRTKACIATLSTVCACQALGGQA